MSSPDARAPATASLRGLRGSVVGLSAAGLGSGGHALAGGVLPSFPALVAAAAGCVAVGIALSGRHWRLPSLLTVLAGAQMVLHVVLGGASGADLVTGAHHHASAPGGAMVLGHLAAAAATALLLQRGEEWCSRLVALLARPLRAVRLALVPVVARPPAPVMTSPAAEPWQWLEHSQWRRGPPAMQTA